MKQGYGFFRDNPKVTAPELLRYDACIPVTAGLDADPEAGIGRQTLPGGAYAVHTHVGSYAEAGQVFSQLHRDIVPKRGLSRRLRPAVHGRSISTIPPSRARCIAAPSCACRCMPVRMPLSSNDDEHVRVGARADPCASGRVCRLS